MLLRICFSHFCCLHTYVVVQLWINTTFCKDRPRLRKLDTHGTHQLVWGDRFKSRRLTGCVELGTAWSPRTRRDKTEITHDQSTLTHLQKHAQTHSGSGAKQRVGGGGKDNAVWRQHWNFWACKKFLTRSFLIKKKKKKKRNLVIGRQCI